MLDQVLKFGATEPVCTVIRFFNTKHPMLAVELMNMQAEQLISKRYLDGQGGDDGLCVDQRGVAQVVQAISAEDLCAGLEPD